MNNSGLSVRYEIVEICPDDRKLQAAVDDAIQG